MKKNLLHFLFTILLLIICRGAYAQNLIVANTPTPITTKLDWKTPSNWQGNKVPSTGDVAIIPAGVTVTYTCTTPDTGSPAEGWFNPTILIYGTLEMDGSATVTTVQFQNNANIYVFSGGTFTDNSANAQFEILNSHMYFYSGAHYAVGPTNGFGNTFFYYNVAQSANPFAVSPATTVPFTIIPSGQEIDVAVNPNTQPPTAPPAAGTASATSILSSSETLKGRVSPGTGTTAASFDWGTSSTLASFNNSAATTPSGGSIAVVVGADTTSTAVTLTGLTPNTTYYYRAKGTNSAGSGFTGSILSFTTPPDAPPVLTTGSTLSYTENGAAAAINTAIAVNDVDNTTQASATVSITTNYAGVQDALSFTNDGSTMGNIAIVTNTAGILTLASTGGTATLAQWQAALRAVKYSNSSDNPSTAARTVSFTINDGTANGNTVTSIINVTAVDDAPVLATGSTLSYTENGAAAAINAAIAVNDVDNTTQASATVAITTNYASAEDVLSLTIIPATMGNVGIVSNTAGVLTLSSSGNTATLAQWQAALRAVKYSNSSDNPSTLARTVSFVINDGALNSNTVNSTINVTAVDDAPVLASGSTLSYTENAAATAINTFITVSDVDNTTQASATVSITTNYAGVQDILSFTNDGSTMGNIFTASNASGVLTLSSASNTATVAQWQAALRAVSYSNSSDNPSTAARAVSFTINDGNLNSNTVTSTINVTAVNDPPVLAGTGTASYTQAGPAATVAPAITVTDADNTNLASATVTISGGLFTGDLLAATTTGTSITAGYSAGVLTLSGSETVAHYQQVLRSVTYSSSSQNPTNSGADNSRTILFTANDGSLNSAAVTATVIVEPSANLSGLALSAGTLSPAFLAATTGYTAAVAGTVSAITLTPTASDVNAVVTVNGAALTAGSASVNLNAGANVITILVAENGVTISYTVTVNRAYTPPGNALAFDGVDDGVIMGPPPAAVSGSFTVEAWLRPADGTKDMHIFSTRSTGEMSFDMQIMNGNTIHGDIGSGSAWLTTAANATFNYNAGQWIHIAYAVTPAGYSIYANGNLVGSGSFSGTPLLMNSTHTTTIGAYPGESTYFNGSIDEVRVYNAALSQANIQADMLSTASSVPLSLVNYYDFDNGAAGGTNTGITTLTDRTTTGYNGTLSNFALSGTTSNWVESYAMVAPAATAATSVGPTGFTANWTAPATGTATSYLVDVSVSPTFASGIPGSPFSTTSTSIPITGLTEASTYYYRVRADKTSVTGEGDYSAVITAITVSHDVTLSALGTTPGTLSPVFTAGTTAYTDTVGNSVTTVSITAVPNDPLATGTILTNGNQLSNSLTANVPVQLGNNNIVITVTAQDGVTQSVYNLSLYRQAGLPVLTTSAVGNISSGSAFFGYQVSSTGGATLTDQGIVYSATDTSPTTADTKVAFGSGTGTFVHFAPGLQAGTAYYAAAYATNATGTAYGSPVSFTTLNTINSITAASSNPTNAASVDYTVTFAGSVTGLSAANFTVTTTGTISGAAVSNISGSGAVYTVTVSTGTGSGTLVLNLDNATGLSPAVSTSLPFAGDTYTIQKTPPAGSNISISTTGAAGPSIAYVGDVVVYSFSVSETPASTPAVTIDGRPADGVYLVYAPANAYQAILNMQPNYTPGNVVGVATVTDAAGNTAQISSASGSSTVTFNNTPNITATGVFGAPETFAGTPGQSEMFTVSGYNLADGGILVTPPAGYELSLDNSSFSSSVTAGNAPTVSATPVYIRLSGAVAGFFSGNVVFSNAAIADVLKPVSTNEVVTALASISAVSTSPTNTSTVSYNVSFISAVAGISASNFTLTTTGNITGASISSVTGSGSSYTVTVNTGTGDGALTLNLANGPVDNALPFAGDTYTIQKTAPVAIGIQFVSNNANGTSVAKVGDGILLNFIASEQIQTPAISIAGHSVTPLNISGNIWSANYTMTSSDTEGPVAFDLQLQDPAGNTGEYNAAGTGALIVFDKTAPTATISAPSITQTGAGTTGTVTYTITYADANFNTSNLANSGITLNTGGSTATGTIGVTGSGTTYTVTISNITGKGSLGITLGAGYASDLAGNTDAGAAASATFNVLSNDDALSNLTLNAGALTPGFSPGVTGYTRNLVNGVNAVTIVPTADDAGASILINGTQSITSGATSAPLPVSVGSNAITILVTAADGVTTQTYTLTLIRAGAKNDLLTSIKLSHGALSPVFTGANANYTARVANGVSSTIITPTASGPNTTILINGTEALASGAASAPIPLSFGVNNITVQVTAQNDTATRIYTIALTRELSANDNLSSLKLNPGAITPVFTTTGTSFTATVANGVTSTRVTSTTADPNATLLLDGKTTIVSGDASSPIPLAVGPNTITVQVNAQDGSTKIYTVTVTRAAAKNDYLTSLKLSRGVLSPEFTGINTSYTANVVNGVSSATVTPTTADPDATLLLNGTAAIVSGAASNPIPLAVGPNVITIQVTAADGLTNQTYTVTITRAAGNADSYSPIVIVTGISVTTPIAIGAEESPTLAEDGIVVHQGISPNGDGINDFLQIDNISQYPDNKLSIMNRNGQLVYEANGYNNSSKIFDGHSNKNGQMQLPGTYFYRLDYTVGGVIKHKTGYLVLKY
jgi:gliding motility-associated-like protein